MKANLIIEGVLRDYPSTRSSDKELLLLVWEKYGFVLSESQKAKFKDLPSMETLVRVRRKLQEEGKYQGNDFVRRHRRFKSLEVQQRMPQTRSEKVQPLLDQREVAAAKRIVNDQTTLI